MDLIDLYEEYRDCRDFNQLRAPHTRIVTGRGSPRPIAMILAEPPGAQEDLKGKPFVGRAGHLLDQLMLLAGLRAEPEYEDAPPGEARQETAPANVFITSVIKYQPLGNRMPSRQEIDRSLPWVRKEWSVLRRPPVIVTMGPVSTACISPMLLPISRSAGEPQPIAAGGPTVWPMYPPSHALRNPSIQPVVEEHWTVLGLWLKKEGLL